jgi:hypothetical protein
VGSIVLVKSEWVLLFAEHLCRMLLMSVAFLCPFSCLADMMEMQMQMPNLSSNHIRLMGAAHHLIPLATPSRFGYAWLHVVPNVTTVLLRHVLE